MNTIKLNTERMDDLCRLLYRILIKSETLEQKLYLLRGATWDDKLRNALSGNLNFNNRVSACQNYVKGALDAFNNAESLLLYSNTKESSSAVNFKRKIINGIIPFHPIKLIVMVRKIIKDIKGTGTSKTAANGMVTSDIQPNNDGKDTAENSVTYEDFLKTYEELAIISLKVPLDGQNTNYTCGSASGSMILNYLGITCSEEKFWAYANSNGNGTYVYRIKDTLNHFYGKDVYKYVNTTNMDINTYYDLIAKSLKNGYPVELPVKFGKDSVFGYNTSGHYVVITSIYTNADGEYMVKINDPFSPNWFSNGHQGQYIEAKLSDIQSYNINHSGFIICNG